MIRRTFTFFAATLGLYAAGVSIPVLAAATPAPAWRVTVTPSPTNFAAGSSPRYLVTATNVGGAPTVGPITLKTSLPEEFTPLSVDAANGDSPSSPEPECTVGAHSVTCATKGAVNEDLHPGRLLIVLVQVSVPPAAPEEALKTEASVEGGGATQAATSGFSTLVSSNAPSFDFLPGFSSPTTNDDGSPASKISPTSGAGSHPYQLTVDLGFPTENPGDGLTGAGHPRDIVTDLPRGLIGNPAATPVLCTEAELISEGTPGCPDASQVGVLDITTLALSEGGVAVETSNLYNMVPPPGTPAEFATNAAGIGVFVHLTTGVRSDGDYGVFASSNDVLALGSNPIFNVQAQIWGDPSSAAHDQTRGACVFSGASCEVEQQKTAFLTMPGDCPGHPAIFKARADSWEEPGLFQETDYESADLLDNSVSLEGCDALAFEPTIEVRPTTSVSDSPSGIDVDLHQPQDTDLEGRSSAILRDATVTFPAGMTVNPSQASGLDSCSPAQIGLATSIGASPIHFSKAPARCPDAAKIGSVEVTTPLLAKFDAEHKVERDSQGNTILEPLRGSVYLAKPFENPFGSLVAVYFTVEDAKTGIVGKLAGRVEPDQVTGQLTTRFEENPELPLEDVRVHLFGGPRAPLITPPTCGAYATTTDLTPWSTPAGADAHPTNVFPVDSAPGGGPCPATEGQLPNVQAFDAGTVTPVAGAYSPLLFRLSREDGSQRLAKIEATLPPGLSARLAGVAECSEDEIARAQAREHPNEGVREKADPSCPAASEVGVVDVSAGAGPTPYRTEGRAYLAGPYRGALLSLVAITPALAGPFDLGAVVVRSALYVDPTTAQARAVSDPLPTILDGIPLDVRSLTLKANRPQFTFNPTSCDEMAFAGAVTSSLMQIAPLRERFQVGGCASLPYGPRLSTRFFGPIHRGGHPRLRAIFQARPGEANTARISFALPRSEFIDQAHFRTICTRVQFNADQCPVESIYGHVRATSPQVDYTLEGPVYLRSSSHVLPDVVVALRGPPRQPVEVDLVGRVDSVNGGLRTIFQAVPDAPVTKAVVTLQGGKKGLFQNSTNICHGIHRAAVKLDGQNGKVHDIEPKLKADCRHAHRNSKGRRHR